MARTLAKRSLPAAPADDGAYIERCQLEVRNEMREVPYSALDNLPARQFEPTGRRRWTFEATIVNCFVASEELIGRPTVFRWPDSNIYVGMIINRLDYEFRGKDITLNVTGDVVGIVNYGDAPTLNHARTMLGLPTLALNEGDSAQ